MSSKKNKNKAKKAAAAAVAEATSTIPPGEEMFYVAPDPNTKMTRPASLAGKIDDSKFVIIWPANINSWKSEKQGRRVPKTHCCDNPIVAEMSEVLTYLKLVHVIEPYKMYPRESGIAKPMPGRVRVQLFKEDGAPHNLEVQTRRALMMKMGALIPKLNIRQQRIAAHGKADEARRQQIAATAATSSGGKKGKKGKR